MTDEIPCAPQLNGKLQHVPLLFRPPAATCQVNWSVPRCEEYVRVPAKSPNNWRRPTLHCVVFGTLRSLFISHSSRVPNRETRASSATVSAVRYEFCHATCPGTGAAPCGAKLMTYVGFEI